MSVRFAEFGADCFDVTDGILDTCFFIDLRSSRNQGATALWNRIKVGEMAASYCAVTAMELWRSRSMDREGETFHELTMSLLLEEAITVAAAKQAGLWLRRFSREMAGRLLGDALIAAIGGQLDVANYTANRRDFERSPVHVVEY
jgi:predicted nucleic acid-binding protein